MSPKVKKFGSFKRQYSTYSGDTSLRSLDEKGLRPINMAEPVIKFDSLPTLKGVGEQGCELIKYNYLGVSGVYKLTNKNDLSRFYIGSSNN